MTPWTLLLLGTVMGAGDARPAPAVPSIVPPAGARCVSGVRPHAWSPALGLVAGGHAGLRIDLEPERPSGPTLSLQAWDPMHDADSLDDLHAEVMGDGSLRLVLGDRLQSYSVVRFDGQGRATFDCTHSASEAAGITRLPAPAPRWEVK